MSPNASHRVRPGLSSAASLITTLLISFDQEVLNQHLNLVTPEYPFFESPCGDAAHPKAGLHLGDRRRVVPAEDFEGGAHNAPSAGLERFGLARNEMI